MKLTQAAIAKLKQFNKEHPDQALRIAIKGGGCSGLLYELKFIEYDFCLDDDIMKCNGLVIVIDPKSAAILENTELDYIDGLEGSGFKFNNPDALSTCGCGSSFGCP